MSNRIIAYCFIAGITVLSLLIIFHAQINVFYHSQVYGSTYDDLREQGKSHVFATHYLQMLDAGKDTIYAKSYAKNIDWGRSEHYAVNYAQQKSQGRSDVYAIAYAEGAVKLEENIKKIKELGYKASMDLILYYTKHYAHGATFYGLSPKSADVYASSKCEGKTDKFALTYAEGQEKMRMGPLEAYGYAVAITGDYTQEYAEVFAEGWYRSYFHDTRWSNSKRYTYAEAYAKAYFYSLSFLKKDKRYADNFAGIYATSISKGNNETYSFNVARRGADSRR